MFHSIFPNPIERIALDIDQLKKEISPHLHEHLIDFVRKYKPASHSEIVKIRRQGIKHPKGPNGMHLTHRAMFEFANSMFIESFAGYPDTYVLHIVDHSQTQEGGMGRVLAVPLLLKINLENKSIVSLKLSSEDANKGITSLMRIKATKMKKPSKKENLFLSREHKAMSLFNPRNPELKELPYAYHKVAGSDKNRLFMPDKGTTLSRLFLKKAWANLSTEELLKAGTRTSSAAEQLCRAIASLHNHPDTMIHRDLKPENIFAKDHESGLYITLGDFGAHCFVKDKCRFYGTLKYSPQEELKLYPDRTKLASHQPSTDIYALCLILAQWLFLKNFSTILEVNVEHRSILETRDQIKQRQIKIVPDIVDYDPKFEPLVVLIKKGFSLEKEERPRAEDLADCIQALTKDYYQDMSIGEEKDTPSP